MPFRGGIFASLAAAFGTGTAPSVGVLITHPTDEPIPPEPEPEPPDACAPFFAGPESNLLSLLACRSEADPVGPPLPLDAFDPADPFSAAAGQCSVLQPQFCRLVIAYFQDVWSSERTLLEGYGIVPIGRWLWESGTEYAIVEATGEFAPYLGGRVFALGPEGARIAEAASEEVVPTPPAGVSLLITEPAPGPMATIFFGAVPEPGSTALAVAAVATLAALARRRTARAAAAPRPDRAV